LVVFKTITTLCADVNLPSIKSFQRLNSYNLNHFFPIENRKSKIENLL
jgi:hypothetical protein